MSRGRLSRGWAAGIATLGWSRQSPARAFTVGDKTLADDDRRRQGKMAGASDHLALTPLLPGGHGLLTTAALWSVSLVPAAQISGGRMCRAGATREGLGCGDGSQVVIESLNLVRNYRPPFGPGYPVVWLWRSSPLVIKMDNWYSTLLGSLWTNDMGGTMWGNLKNVYEVGAMLFSSTSIAYYTAIP